MGYNYGKKKTFGQKAKSFLIKTTLTAAFMGVAGGTLYCFSTQEDVAAQVQSSPTEEDTMTPEACAMNANLPEIAQKTPQIARDLALMEKLPLTGQPVFEKLGNPAHGIKSCLFPVPEKSARMSTYSSKLARIARGSRTTATFHEYFHALQDINGDSSIYRLTQKDAVIGILLQEAAAVAYEIAARHEAENKGLTFFEPLEIVEQVLGETVTYSIISASTDKETNAAFRTAYDTAWKQNSGADAETREAKALDVPARGSLYVPNGTARSSRNRRSRTAVVPVWVSHCLCC
jgi:hypothetical protein